jgi:hypothetical protein
LEEIGGPMAAGKEEAVVDARMSREKEGEERKKEERERGRRSLMPVQVKASCANPSAMTESRCLLWRDWWTHGTRQLGHQLRHSKRRDIVTPTRPA